MYSSLLINPTAIFYYYYYSFGYYVMVCVWWQRKTLLTVKNGGKLRRYIINGLEPVSVIDHATIIPGNCSCLLDKVHSYIVIIITVVIIILVIFIIIIIYQYIIVVVGVLTIIVSLLGQYVQRLENSNSGPLAICYKLNYQSYTNILRYQGILKEKTLIDLLARHELCTIKPGKFLHNIHNIILYYIRKFQ